MNGASQDYESCYCPIVIGLGIFSDQMFLTTSKDRPITANSCEYSSYVLAIDGLDAFNELIKLINAYNYYIASNPGNNRSLGKC